MTDTVSGEACHGIAANALRKLREIHAIGDDPSSWRFAALSPNNPIWRVTTGGRSWIVKRSADPKREVVTHLVFAYCGVPSFEIQFLCDDWLSYEDLKLPALDDCLDGGGVKPRPTPALFRALGVAAAQADLVGMRDRNLRNMLVDGSDAANPRLVLIDYESAFRAGIADRMLRPGRYLAYLLRRMFLDVLKACPPESAERREALRVMFEEGMLDELTRLAARPIAGLGGLGLRQRMTLATRFKTPASLQSHLPAALRRAFK